MSRIQGGIQCRFCETVDQIKAKYPRSGGFSVDPIKTCSRVSESVAEKLAKSARRLTRSSSPIRLRFPLIKSVHSPHCSLPSSLSSTH